MNRGRSRSPVRRDRDDSRRRDESVTDRKFNPNSDRMVYVTNLNFKMEWKELKDIIREHAEVSFVEILKNRDGKSKGVAVVELTTKEGARKCIDALHRKEIGGRTLTASEIRDPGAFFRKIRDDTGVDFLGGSGVRDRRSGPTRDRRPSPGLSYSGETYGLSASFLDSLNLKLPLVNRVFVTNIDYTCSVGKLFDVFSMAGRITWFDLQLDKEGKSRGMAVVEYSHPIEAVQAISMLHNQRLIDRTLTVKMDRFEKEADRRRDGVPIGLKHVGMGLGANGAPLKDIASVIGQVSHQSSAFSSNGSSGIASFQSSSQSYPAYQQPLTQSTQPLASAFEQSHYSQQASSVPVYGQSIRQLSPPPANVGYYSQGSNYGADQTTYGKSQSSYAVKSEIPARGGYSSVQNAQPTRQHHSYATTEQTPSRVIVIKNLPEDYTWNVIASRIKQFGDFESVDLIGSGVAKVRFLHVQEAERAHKALNGTQVENNTIYVDYII